MLKSAGLKEIRQTRTEMKEPVFSNGELLAYLEMRWAEDNRFLTQEQMTYYMQFRLWMAPEDTAYVVLLNRSRYYMRSIRLTEGMLHRVNLLSEEIRILLEGASYFFIGHTHAEKSTEPSPEDRNTTRILAARYPEKPKFLGQIIVNHQLNSTYIQP